jgi:hypothetical protein
MSWESYERSADKGPMSIAVKVILSIFILSILIGGLGFVAGWFSEAAQVAQDQFGPGAMLKKYEYFKDVAAQLDKKKADIAVYEGRLTGMKDTYKSVERIKWPREDREQYNVWASEVAGVKASFNQLAADYNAQMAKFNWRFANVGELPKGATEPLPREYKSYVTE